VTDARLLRPEPDNWLMYRGNYAGWGFSALHQINAANVHRLKLAWAYSTGMTGGHESPPIVNCGFMYITTPNNQVIALDAASGQERWRYKETVSDELQQLHPTNRGVALYADKVYLATTDAALIALDAASGKELWKTAVADWRAGYYMTLAPLAVHGKILVGVSGGEYGIRGFVAAFDAATGKEAWRTYTVPAAGEKGYDSWPAGTAEHGGAPVWITGTYDPATNLSFWGTGNPGPWTPDARLGDNLYANSVIALDADSGELKGYHQYHWNDGWDWDETSAPLLVDVVRGGRTVKSLVHAGRNGYIWVLDRGGNGLNFVDAWPFVQQNVFTAIDPHTGRPSYDPTHVMHADKTVAFCPSLWGGKDWPPEAYSPATGLFYVPANNNLCAELTDGTGATYSKGELYIGVDLDKILNSTRMGPGAKDHIGEVQAWNLNTGKRAWVHDYKEMNWGPLLATAGDLVFGGGTNDRQFHAFDARSGRLLWHYPAPSGIMGVPSSFAVDGRQYVAVQAGWGVDAQRMQGAFDSVLDHKTVVPEGGVLLVFALDP
jgi:alcohol dehydrogenase (cytochrome c)